MVKDNGADLGEENLLGLFCIMVGISGFHRLYMLEGYTPIQTRNSFSLVPNSSLGVILNLKCLIVSCLFEPRPFDL